MPSWCVSGTLYKGIFTLILALIALEYLFGSITETKRWDTIFPFNTTRIPVSDKGIQHIHSPLLKSPLVNNRNNNTINLNNLTRNFITTSNSSLDNQISTTNYTATVNISASFDTNSSSSTEIEILPEYNKINTTGVPFCPDVPPNLRGKIEVVKYPVPSVQQLEQKFSWLKPGGHSLPESCKVIKKVALIVPFRCRGEHLLLFLQHMHPFLRRQQLDYTIFIIEQLGDGAFNRAMLMNVGFKEALKMSDYDCFIFHDIDLLPENDRNLYTCPEQPRHMSVAVDIFKYKLPYPAIFGGVSAITKEHFEKLNGFSNSFWGWGGEDDDMSNRIRYHNLHISRYPITIARYTMLTHVKDKPSPNRYEILKSGQKRFDTDGLNSLHYTIKQMKKNLLYTWLLVEVEPPS